MERESSLGFGAILRDTVGGRLLAPGQSQPRSTRGLKWIHVLLAAMLIVLGLVFSPVLKQSDLPAVAGSPPDELDPLLLRPGAYNGVDLAWADLRQATLVGANMQRAALLGADLNGADLRQAHLDGASLLGANMGEAHLQGTTLSRANLHWAYLGSADLRGADLRRANLNAANLEYANLFGTSLTYADLSRAQLRGAILPDGTRWTPSSDLARFTDPAHPDFWPEGDRDTIVLSLRHLPELSVMH